MKWDYYTVHVVISYISDALRRPHQQQNLDLRRQLTVGIENKYTSHRENVRLNPHL